jgi:uncharacterized protein (DUF305 family)
MEKNNATIIVAGLGIVLAFIIGFMSYNLGMESGARNMHMGMMDMDEKSGTEKPEKLEKVEKMGMMDHSQMTMDEMTEGLKGLKGDAFDKAFVEMMIVHHQGAVDMAKAIPENAKHTELKKLGVEIISAQTKEIQMMKQWLKDWGYADDGMMQGGMKMEGMDHSMMGM